MFQSRSEQKEILDSESIPKDELHRNLIELNIINKYLGGYKATLKGLKKIFRSKDKIVSILDIGFGGGDSIREMQKFAESHQYPIKFYGVDIKKDCLDYAKLNLKNHSNVELICDDYRNLNPDFLKTIDLIHCSLFLHHLSNSEIVDFFKFSKMNNCRLLINDLHRNFLAYHSIRLLTKFFSKSRLVKNDAPISVLRGFKRRELSNLLSESGFGKYSINWSWAFRFVIVAEK